MLQKFSVSNVTLKTGVMAAENSALHHKNKLGYILKYII